MFRYYYDPDTGEIKRKNKGNLNSIEPWPSIDTAEDVNISQYIVDVNTKTFVHTPRELPSRTR